VTDLESFPKAQGPFDTVICLNVVEHVEDDKKSLRNIREVLAEGGRAIVLVPQGQWNFGTLDEVLGHHRRYSKEALRQLALDCGFELKELLEFNRIGTLGWFLNGKILKRRKFGLLQILALNALTPLLRLVDRLLPIPSLSLIAVLERKSDGQGAQAA
jgi:SAM-dependent methyltransferase